MIKTKEDLFDSPAEFSAIGRELAEELYKSTKNAELKALLDKNKPNVLISLGLKVALKTSYEAQKDRMSKARDSRKGKGGRPRLPDPTEPEKLTGAELRKYNFRKWQRECRDRKKKLTEVQN